MAMSMSGLILKKRAGEALSESEIQWMVGGYTAAEIPDYQMSAMLMAICFQGMTEAETLALTMAMRDSGDVMDLGAVEGPKADKHSTGGVGDKTSLLLCPMLACCGVKMAKMSGRGLGHTGGTLDKMESFPQLTTQLSRERFVEIVNRVGFAIVGQTGNLCPADKKLYSLRDVTGTVAAEPLIVSSIMSKKLAANGDIIVLDVKTGSGSFTPTEESAFSLARSMVKIGRLAGKQTAALVTDMDEPLGFAVGNALEVKEVIAALRGEGPKDLTELCFALGAQILRLSGLAADENEARTRLQETIDSGAALERFADFVGAQGGEREAVYNTSLLPLAPVQREVEAQKSGYLAAIDALGVGRVSLQLGGGRATKEDGIDLSVGVVLKKKVGDAVTAGESLATVHAATDEAARAAAESLRALCRIESAAPPRKRLIKGLVTDAD